jgi:hypothetical protein
LEDKSFLVKNGIKAQVGAILKKIGVGSVLAVLYAKNM